MKSSKPANKKTSVLPHDWEPIIMVSSTVYGIEHLLNRIYGTLRGIGYKVWMSHRGTIPLNPAHSNFTNCLEAATRCDLFLSIITGSYGSGKKRGELSITHREMLEAIQQNKLRWFLVHRDIITARQILRQFQTKTGGWQKGFKLAENPVIGDLRIIDMYEAAIRRDLPLDKRTGNWAQPFLEPDEALQFVEEQFGDIKRIKQIIRGDRS